MIESPVLKALEEEWKAEAMAEGKAEGKAAGKAEAVLEVLRARFETIPEELESRILRIRDESLLGNLLARAARAASLQEFQAHFPR